MGVVRVNKTKNYTVLSNYHFKEKSMGQPLTVRGLELLRERVRELVGLDTTKQKQLLRTAVINNWKNVYPKGEEPTDNDDLNKLKDFYS